MTAALAALILLPRPFAAAADPPIENQVLLELQVAGIGRDGCTLEIKPGHPGCQFEPITRKLDATAASRGLRLPVRATSKAADRDCSFTITITEPDHAPKMYRRGLRLATPKPGESTMPRQILRCYFSSPSLAKRDESTTRR
jgi:hypothetical protein